MVRRAALRYSKPSVSSARTKPIVAIDGPAGAGKSTVARLLAKELDFVLVDTGAMYRVVALAADRQGIPFDDAPRVSDVAAELVREEALAFERADDGTMIVRLRGEDVSAAIRTPRIGLGASTVSAVPGVRKALLDLQRQAGRAGGVVLEGRDIGTVVFPDADIKFYLTATLDTRARRRHDELASRGSKETFEEVVAEVAQRDRQDSTREHAPLRAADDAVTIDSTRLDIVETVRALAERVRRLSDKV